MSPASETSSRALREGRAIALLCVISVHLGAALPLVQPVTPQSLAQPFAAKEFALWASVFAPFGLQEETFASLLIDTTSVLVNLQNATTRPAKHALRTLGMGQGWELFAIPEDTPQRLEIRTQTGEQPFVVRYRRHDPDLTWHADLFAYRKIRAIYDQKRPTPSFRQWTDHVAALAFAEDPDVEAVRILTRRRHVSTPDEPADASETRGLFREITRADLEAP